MDIFGKFRNELEKRNLWEVFLYLFFGGLTTLVNFICYFLCREVFSLTIFVSNLAATVIAILFAFFTNKIFVFQSETKDSQESVLEFLKFIFFRVLSFGLDYGTLAFCVRLIGLNEFIGKLISQIVVIVANYLFSKLFIFKKKDIIIEEVNHTDSQNNHS